jgi:hypothetical protein
VQVDVDELMKRAWGAVEKAGVPEAAQPAALQEAVAYLREQEGGDGDGIGGGGGGRGTGGGRANRTSSAGKRVPSPSPTAHEEADLTDEETFFASLATESGVDEPKLRDVLVYKGGKVMVQQPARVFGNSRAAQAKALTALVAGARSRGMGESPVKAEAVHEELKRKHCWDHRNYAAKHLGKLQGFNGGSDRTEITTTSKWVGEFEAAVKQALGEDDDK